MKEFCLLWLNLLADVLRFLLLGLRPKGSLAAENLFLRKQLGVLPGTQNQAPPDLAANALDPAVAQPLVRLARRSNRRDAADLHRLAPPELPVLLAPEVPSWSVTDSAGAPSFDPKGGA